MRALKNFLISILLTVLFVVSAMGIALMLNGVGVKTQ